LIEKARDHLIQFGRHPEFRVWKGPRPKDDFDEEWATSAWKTRTIAKRVQVDEGVNMEDMVENLFQQPLGEEEPQYGNVVVEDVDLASSHIIQSVLEIVDELATQFESMPNTFEGNVSHE
jgi:hypothetical protein